MHFSFGIVWVSPQDANRSLEKKGKKKSHFELLQHRVTRLDTANTPTQSYIHGHVLGPWLVTARQGR